MVVPPSGALSEPLRPRSQVVEALAGSAMSMSPGTVGRTSVNAKAVTGDCPSKKLVMPLYVEGDEFVTPFCCYGNDVDCDLCGGWVVFYLAAKMEKERSADRSARGA